jgi:MraZ protein
VVNNTDPILVGEFVHSVDAKGRVAIPSSFRKKLNLGPGDKLVLSRGLTQCIEAHTVAEWAVHVAGMLGGLSLYDPKVRRLRTTVLSQANEVELDGQGRVLLPRNLREMSGVGNEAAIIGQRDFFEVWEPVRYRSYLAESETTFDKDLAEAAGGGTRQVRLGDDGDRQARNDVSPTGDGR